MPLVKALCAPQPVRCVPERTRLERSVLIWSEYAVGSPEREHAARDVADAASKATTATQADLFEELVRNPKLTPEDIAEAARKALIRGSREGGRWG